MKSLTCAGCKVEHYCDLCGETAADYGAHVNASHPSAKYWVELGGVIHRKDSVTITEEDEEEVGKLILEKIHGKTPDRNPLDCRLLSWNAQSIALKAEAGAEYAKTNGATQLGVAESWLRTGLELTQFLNNGMVQVARADRSEGPNLKTVTGGGTVDMIDAEDTRFKIVDITTAVKHECGQVTALYYHPLDPNWTPFVVINIYVSEREYPNMKAEQLPWIDFASAVLPSSEVPPRLIVMGDPNISGEERATEWLQWAEEMDLTEAMPLVGHSRPRSRTTPDSIMISEGIRPRIHGKNGPAFYGPTLGSDHAIIGIDFQSLRYDANLGDRVDLRMQSEDDDAMDGNDGGREGSRHMGGDSTEGRSAKGVTSSKGGSRVNTGIGERQSSSGAKDGTEAEQATVTRDIRDTRWRKSCAVADAPQKTKKLRNNYKKAKWDLYQRKFNDFMIIVGLLWLLYTSILTAPKSGRQSFGELLRVPHISEVKQLAKEVMAKNPGIFGGKRRKNDVGTGGGIRIDWRGYSGVFEIPQKNTTRFVSESFERLIRLEQEEQQQLLDLQAELLALGVKYASEDTIPRGYGRKKGQLKWASDVVLMAKRDTLKQQGRFKEAAIFAREIANRTTQARHEQFEGLIEGVDFTADGMRKAYGILEKMETGKPLYSESRRSPIISDGRVLQTEEEEARAFEKQYNCQKRPPPEQVEKEEAEVWKEIQERIGNESGEKEWRTTITTTHVAFRSIRTAACAGPDEIDGAQLKHAPDSVRAFFRRLTESSVNYGMAPTQYRMEITVPVEKPGKPLVNVSSWRPVSLTCAGSKVMERIVVSHFSESFPASDTQKGYQPHRSTVENLGIIIGEIESGKVDGRHTIAVYIDKKSAFERVFHARLLRQMLKKCKTRTAAMETRWLRAFLKGRRRRLKWGEVLTEPQTLEAIGCPQGSVVGPQCWTWYVEDLIEELRNAGVLHLFYADDCIIWAAEETAEAAAAKVQIGLQILEKWCLEANMEVSIGKTHAVHYSPASTGPTEGQMGECVSPPLWLDGSVVGYVDEVRFLGVDIGEDLDMDTHLKRITKKSWGRMNCVAKMAKAGWKPRTIHIASLYLALVDSVLFYGCGAWGGMLNRSQLRKIDRLQEHAARVILGVGREVSGASAMCEAGLIPAAERIRAESGYLVCVSRTRRSADPLLEAGESRATWASVGREMLKEAGLSRYIVEAPENKYGGVDIFRSDLAINLAEAEACEEDLRQAHSDGKSVYYCDGAAGFGIGVAGLVKFSGERIVRCKTRQIAETEADAFTAEQVGVLECLEDLEKDPPQQECTIFTDSLSTILSLASPGVRDRREKKIAEKLAELGQRITITIQFVRSHNGWVGNELVDAYATMAWKHTDAGIKAESGRTVALNLCKGRIWERANERVTESLRVAAARSASANHLWSVSGAMEPQQSKQGLKPRILLCNPLLRKSLETKTQWDRRDEKIYNGMRLGDAMYGCGFRTKFGAERVCHSCKQNHGKSHALLECPTNWRQRQEMWKRIHEERKKRSEEGKERAVADGRESEEPGSKTRLRWNMPKLAILTNHPDAVLAFVRSSNFWLDFVAPKKTTRRKHTMSIQTGANRAVLK